MVSNLQVYMVNLYLEEEVKICSMIGKEVSSIEDIDAMMLSIYHLIVFI